MIAGAFRPVFLIRVVLASGIVDRSRDCGGPADLKAYAGGFGHGGASTGYRSGGGAFAAGGVAVGGVDEGVVVGFLFGVFLLEGLFKDVGVFVHEGSFLVVCARIVEHELEVGLELREVGVVTVADALPDLVEGDGGLDDVVIVGEDLLAREFLKDFRADAASPFFFEVSGVLENGLAGGGEEGAVAGRETVGRNISTFVHTLSLSRLSIISD